MGKNTIDYNEVIYQIDKELKRISWTTEKAVNHIQFYYGVKSRMHLKDDDLLEFLDFLRAYKKPSKFKVQVKRYTDRF